MFPHNLKNVLLWSLFRNVFVHPPLILAFGAFFPEINYLVPHVPQDPGRAPSIQLIQKPRTGSEHAATNVSTKILGSINQKLDTPIIINCYDNACDILHHICFLESYILWKEPLSERRW